MQHVYVLHGYSASPEDHWFQDIKNQLNGDQTQVTLIHFPDSAYPDVKAWQGTLDHHIPKIDDTTFFVAHSLGVISLLHFFIGTKYSIWEECCWFLAFEKLYLHYQN